MSQDVSLKAIHHIRTMGCGLKSHLVLCENGDLCVVRLRSTTQRSEPIAAVVASRIARTFGLPTPECVVVKIGDSLLRETPELSKMRELRREDWIGDHSGTLYVRSQDGSLFDLLPDPYLDSLNNPESFLHFLALDKWCSHSGPPKPVFYRSGSGSQHSVEFVSRGGSLCGAGLGFRDHPLNGVYYQKAVYDRVTGWDSFDPILSNLILASPDGLYRTTKDLPFGWSEEHRDELDRLVESLLVRRSRIRQLITQSRDQVPGLFPSWTRRTFVPPQHRFEGSPLLRLIRSGK